MMLRTLLTIEDHTLGSVQKKSRDDYFTSFHYKDTMAVRELWERTQLGFLSIIFIAENMASYAPKVTCHRSSHLEGGPETQIYWKSYR
jgi:hypothetical protein